MARILEVAPAVKLLVTSRERLNLHWEQSLVIHGLSLPQAGEVANAEDHSAVGLFLQSAQRARADFLLSDENRPHVSRMCRLVEGLPLAIELAAAWVKSLSCQEIAQEIEQDFDFLTGAWGDAPSRHRSLRAVFEHSWRLLTAQKRQVFSQLSVFRGGFQREAAEHVTGAAPSLLLALVDKSFLRWEPSTERYTAHEVLRHYAAEILALAPREKEKTLDRHCEYFAALLQRRETTLRSREQSLTLRIFDREIGNVRQAWGWAVKRAQVDQIEHSLTSLCHFYDVRGRFREGEALLAQAVQELHEPKVVGKLQARQGVFCYRLGRYEEAKELLHNSLKAAQAPGDRKEKAFCLIALAKIAIRQGVYAEARGLLEQALALAQTAGWCQLEADSLLNLGTVSYSQGDYATARSSCERARHIYLELGDRRGESEALNGLAIVVARSAGVGVESKTYFERVLHLSHELGDRRGEAGALNNLGLVSRHLGYYTQAEAYFKRALRTFRNVGNRRSEALVLNNLGFVYAIQGYYTRARHYYEQALLMREEIGDRHGKSQTLADMALCHHLSGDDETAREHARQSLHILRDLGNCPDQGFVLTYLGYALEGLGHLAQAFEIYQQALTLQRDLDQCQLALEIQAGLARVSLAQGNLSQAFDRAEEILNELQINPHENANLRIYLTCYRVLRANHAPRAQTILSTAHSLLQERAAKIKDKNLRRSFLEHVRDHREIRRELCHLQRLAQAAQ